MSSTLTFWFSFERFKSAVVVTCLKLDSSRNLSMEPACPTMAQGPTAGLWHVFFRGLWFRIFSVLRVKWIGFFLQREAASGVLTTEGGFYRADAWLVVSFSALGEFGGSLCVFQHVEQQSSFSDMLSMRCLLQMYPPQSWPPSWSCI